MSGGDDDGGERQKKPPGSTEVGFWDFQLSEHQFSLPTEVAVGQERLYEQAYRELARLITGKEPSDTPPPEWAFREKVLEFLEQNRERYYQKICVDFEYCERKKRFKNGSDFMVALIGMIGLLMDILGCGVASALWLMSTAVLDQFCRCEQPQEKAP